MCLLLLLNAKMSSVGIDVCMETFASRCLKAKFYGRSHDLSPCPSISSRMRFMNHNWSATKQRLHPQSVAEISRHSVLSWDRIQQCETSSGSRHKDTDQCL